MHLCTKRIYSHDYFTTNKYFRRIFGKQFINDHFKYYNLCDWTPGMKFMVMPERKDIIIPPFKSAETNKEVDTGELKHKILNIWVRKLPNGALYILTLNVKGNNIITNLKTPLWNNIA